MAHAQKPDFVFLWNGWVHLYRRGRQFSRLLAGELCASAVVGLMLDTPCSEVVWRLKSTGYPLHSPVSHSLPLPCFTVCHHISTGLYLCLSVCFRLQTWVDCFKALKHQRHVTVDAWSEGLAAEIRYVETMWPFSVIIGSDESNKTSSTNYPLPSHVFVAFMEPLRQITGTINNTRIRVDVSKHN
jgi:hypothetical protein